jgi:alpha-1,2-mannosyltransferase
MVGATRGKDDEAIVHRLKEMADELGILDSVKFAINRSRTEVIEIFKQASIALHTMKYEHFGISIVEMMAAGIVTIAHESAGPKLDIIKVNQEKPVGYLAKNLEDYISILHDCMRGYKEPYYADLR